MQEKYTEITFEKRYNWDGETHIRQALPIRAQTEINIAKHQGRLKIETYKKNRGVFIDTITEYTIL
jgi:hypothetical protein